MTSPKKDRIVSIEEIKHNGCVYDLEVEDAHTFMANDIFVHNTDSIFIHKAGSTREEVEQCLKAVVEEIKRHVPFPSDTFGISIEALCDYICWPFSLQAVRDGNGKIIRKELHGKRKNYVYIANGKLKAVGLPVIKDNATMLGSKLFREVISPAIMQQNRAKFPKSWIKSIINEALSDKDNLKLMAVEYKVKPAKEYKNASQIQAQISNGYFHGDAGVIQLIKNKAVGRAGKGSKYCTIEEWENCGATAAELDLTKLKNELEPFVEN